MVETDHRRMPRCRARSRNHACRADTPSFSHRAGGVEQWQVQAVDFQQACGPPCRLPSGPATDRPVTSGGSVATNTENGSGGRGAPDFASAPDACRQGR
jgi:hypothetical protein